ncbi:MAG TPA: hypothetical protein EYO51_06680 [Methylococcaceae bacterium]|jgi:hypothetical protein|nr:hypothetical protein [Methylococcaceae bacterium]HIN68898.1 hypothetical protein [Methylococcales bacterium]HIA44308.1 hypothetical protein [Methylococcaceae bacterium]HIB62810.1 hypothetical protein [Methylococcaceae bacterium]HIO12257.1 hypothetical protein [Methylococcales bacterium]
MRYSLIIILAVFLTPANANSSQREQQDMVSLGESLLGCVSAMSQSFNQTPILAIDGQGRTITIQLTSLISEIKHLSFNIIQQIDPSRTNTLLEETLAINNTFYATRLTNLEREQLLVGCSKLVTLVYQNA